MNEISQQLRDYYLAYGPPKSMNSGTGDPEWPHFFLHRCFLGEQDLAILFYTKRCRYQCAFCALPMKAPHEWIDAATVRRQFLNVISEVKHAIGVIERLTVANEGSVFDESTFPPDALEEIVSSVAVLPNIRKLVLESRLEFVSAARLVQLGTHSGKQLDVLTGFETVDEQIRDVILRKKEPLSVFLAGLDQVAEANAELTAYVLYKPDPEMTDIEAADEAERSIDYIVKQCDSRKIPLTIRLNPMYVARGTPWAKRAHSLGGYKPPRLTDVIDLSDRKIREGTKIYLGLTSEDLSEPQDTYRGREDYSSSVLKRGILSNLKRPVVVSSAS